MDRFEEAQRLVMARDFAGAIAIYRNLYQNSPDDAVKARALLEWAQAEHSPVNPDRDADAAAARLKLLLERYPDSAFAAEAADDLAAIEG
jgi:outer membrane protein assembly factor BamD (BamD/ComL family)